MNENETTVMEPIDGAAADASAVPEPAVPAETVTVTETIVIVEDRPFWTTSFSDYTVTEGLLLLVFVLVLLQFFLNLFRRWL